MCLLAFTICIFFCEVFVQISCPFSLGWFSYHWIVRILCIFQMQIFYQMYVLQIYFLPVLTWEKCIFQWAKYLVLIKFKLSFVFFMVITFCILRKLCQSKTNEIFYSAIFFLDILWLSFTFYILYDRSRDLSLIIF